MAGWVFCWGYMLTLALYVLYTYMLGQRRKWYRKQKAGKTVGGANKAR